MSHLFPSEETTQPNYWRDCKRLLPHALVCITLSEQWDIDRALRITLINHVAAYLSNCAHYNEAEPLLRRAIEIGEQATNCGHVIVAETLHNLGLLYLKQGKYEQAEAIHRQMLELRTKLLGAEHPNTLHSMNNLALVLDNQGKYEEAETMHRQTLELRTKVLGAEHL